MPRDIHIKIFKDGHYLIAKGELDDKNTLITQGTDEQNLREMIVDAMSVLWNIKTPYEIIQELEKEIRKLQWQREYPKDMRKFIKGIDKEMVQLVDRKDILALLKSKKESLK